MEPLERLANVLPFADYIPSDHYAMEMARSQELFTKVSQLPSLKARKDFIDVIALFEGAMGLSHRTLSMLVFGWVLRSLRSRWNKVFSRTKQVFDRARNR